MTTRNIKNQLKKYADKDKAKVLQGFFKTGKGEYGEGDIFMGVTVPKIRAVAKKNKSATLTEIKELLSSKVHETRLLALLILLFQFKEGNESQKKKMFNLYIKNMRHINNWDLVDLSAPGIVGSYLLGKDTEPLFTLALSKDLWERRISIISTFYFIKNMSFDASLAISELLITDKEDLIQKAVGWMLREIGKRDLKREEEFLLKHCRKMPRTMLRYAIERFEENKRQRYLKGTI